MAKSAHEQLNADKQPKFVDMDKDFAGIKKGQRMFVATPGIVDAYIKGLPRGRSETVAELRQNLAQANNCDASCPVSTAIFVRISAQAAIDELNEGTPIAEITPFWRVLTSKDKITKKLTIDAQWLDQQRESEQN